MKLTLKHLYLLNEEAITAKEARSSKMALYITKTSSGEDAFILIDATVLLTNTKYALDILDIYSALTHELENISKQFVIGALAVSRNPPWGKAYGSSAIEFSAAKPGYGPILYDIAMSYEKGLTPDRYSVSASAKKVWNFYLKNRSDVKKLPLDDAQNPKTKTKLDDSNLFNPKNKNNPLNYAYFSTKKVAVRQLTNNYDKLVVALFNKIKKESPEFLKYNRLTNFKKFKQRFAKGVEDAGRSFFDSKYQGNG